MSSLANKKIAVIGLGKRTGVAAARKLHELGAEVIVSDIKNEQELKEEINMLADCNIKYDLSGHSGKSLQADLIVVSPGVPLTIPFFKKAKEKNIPVISEIELAYYLTEANIIAITGTNGKTTTTRLLGNILEKSRILQARVAGNIGQPLIGEVDGLTEEGWLVVEVSSFQLETTRYFHPKISIYLNFTPDHLDRHKNEKEYWLAKKKIFANQKEDDYALINYDDENVLKAARECKARIMNVSMKNILDRGAYLEDGKLIIALEEREELIGINEIPLKGKHNISNVAFASLAARLIGVDIKVIREQIRDFIPEAHRLEKIITSPGSRITIYDDSKATNPDAAVKALLSFAEPVVLIAGGQDRNANFAELAEVIAHRVKTLILMGETADKLAEQVLKNGFTNIYKVKDMEEAVNIAAKNIEKSDCLLLSPGCPSWDMYNSYRERGRDFKECLEKAGFEIERRKHT